MKFLATLVLGMTLASVVLAQADLLGPFCWNGGGKIIDSWTCPNSKRVRSGRMCELTNKQGQKLVFNGCSAPSNPYNDFFFKACLLHDLCYHHEPVSNKKAKEQCDSEFLYNMQTLCVSTNMLDEGYWCFFAAQTYYKAVSVGGGLVAWECSKEYADYPQRLDDLR